MTPKVSIVMSTYNRASLLENTLQSIRRQQFLDYEIIIVDDGNDVATPALVHDWQHYYENLRYIRLNRQKYAGYNNPGYPNNVGLRQATGELIVLQNAECRYVGDNVLSRFVSATKRYEAVLGEVEVLNEAGSPYNTWYTHSVHSPRPFFFCGCLRREWFHKLRGFDEDYTYYGMEDVDFADRLVKAGVKFTYSDIPIQHQWHGDSRDPNDRNNNIPIELYHRKTRDMAVGLIGIERNLEKDWGKWPI